MGRKRKLFLGNRPIAGAVVKSRRAARKITTEYHRKIHEIAKLKQEQDLQQEDTPIHRIKELEKELIQSGGIDRYQQASQISTSHFKTSRWIIRSLDQLDMLRREKGKEKLQVLEVGAINIQLHACSFMTVRSIDLNSQHPLIEEIDFFDIPPTASYDVVVASMVINYVPSPQKRAEMLARLNAHLTSNGVLFLVLPTRCITSKFIGGLALFNKVLRSVGLVDVKCSKLEMKSSPKLSYFVLKQSFSSLPKLEHMNMSWQRILSHATQMLQKEGKWLKRFIVNTSGSSSSSSSSSKAIIKRKSIPGMETIENKWNRKEGNVGKVHNDDEANSDDDDDGYINVSEFSLLFKCVDA